MTNKTLPNLNPDEREFTERTVDATKSLIDRLGGWIPFDEYANFCLYDPEAGYYGAWIRGIGSDGDYVTAPEMGPFFNEIFAKKLGNVLERNGGSFLELGAGTGKFARGMIETCSKEGFGIQSYEILEISGRLRGTQAKELAEAPPNSCKVGWLDALPRNFSGIVFGNELIDAVPCSIYRRGSREWLERGVCVRDGKLAWEDRPLASEEGIPGRLEKIDADEGYLAEINHRGEALARSLAGAMERGILVLVDYGFNREEYYHPQRTGGTLMCHWRHRAFPDPLALPGISDITSHVDFTGIANAAAEGGCEMLGFCDMGSFLSDSISEDMLAEMVSGKHEERLSQASNLKRLLMPQEMGQLYKVMVLGKGECLAPAMGLRERAL